MASVKGWNQIEQGTVVFMSDATAVFMTSDGKAAHFAKLRSKPHLSGCD